MQLLLPGRPTKKSLQEPSADSIFQRLREGYKAVEESAELTRQDPSPNFPLQSHWRRSQERRNERHVAALPEMGSLVQEGERQPLSIKRRDLGPGLPHSPLSRILQRLNLPGASEVRTGSFRRPIRRD